MANKFTRNVTGTNLGGNKVNKNDKPIESFMTNLQNDLLSDDTDVYVRQAKNKNPESEDKYFCLTDGIKVINSNSTIGTTHVDKNTMNLIPNIATKEQAETGVNNTAIMTSLRTKQAIDYQVPDLVKEHETPTEIISKSEELTVTNTSKNNFELEIEFPENNEEVIITSDKGNLTVTEVSKNNFKIDMKTILPDSYSETVLQQEFWGFEKITGGRIRDIGTNGTQNSELFVSIKTMEEVMTVLFNKITALENEIDALKGDGGPQ